MGLVITILIMALLILLVAFLIKRNWMDQKEYENQTNQDYPHSTKSPTDIDTEDQMH